MKTLDHPNLNPEDWVLFVDDDPSFIELITFGLAHERTVFCSESQEAYDLLVSRPFSLLITDTNMPLVNGIDLLCAVRRDPGLSNVAVMVLFSELIGSPITKPEVYRLGADWVLSKEAFLEQASWILSETVSLKLLHP